AYDDRIQLMSISGMRDRLHSSRPILPVAPATITGIGKFASGIKVQVVFE
ncbi:MAG: hypothetical protein HC935_08665, partial [Pseudanabaena sp. SU_2_4]|nr:hypothetical protein [Pseudanabaena sp. SU_2_4]